MTCQKGYLRGFVNYGMDCAGVLNTDNMSILGLTIDYGPYGYMDRYTSSHPPLLYSTCHWPVTEKDK